MKSQEEKIELHKKVRRRIYVRDITFLTACSPLYVFLLFHPLLAPPTQVLAEWPLYIYIYIYIAMGEILCDDMCEQSKIC